MNDKQKVITLFALTSWSALTLPSFGQDETVFELNPFEVTPTEGYAATNTISGTAMNTSLKNVPMSINVITSQFLEDSHIGDFREALDYNSSITQTTRQPISNNVGMFAIRGFRNRNNLVDGVLGSDFVPTFLIDRIEVVKGPNTLYGQSDPGGLVNSITKKPKAKDETILALKAGNNGWLEAQADVNVRSGDEGQFGFRFLASHRENDGWRPIGGQEEQLLAGIGEYRFTENTTGIFSFAHSEKEGVPTNRATWSFERRATDLNGDGDFDDTVDGVGEANARYNNSFIPDDFTTATTSNIYEQTNQYLTLGLRHTFENKSNLQYIYKHYEADLFTTFREFNTFGTDGTTYGAYNNDSNINTNEVHTVNYNSTIEFGENRHELLLGLRHASSTNETLGSYRLRTDPNRFAGESAKLDELEASTGKTFRRLLTKQDVLNGTRIWEEGALSKQEHLDLGADFRTNLNDYSDNEILTAYLTDNIFLMDDRLNILAGVRYVDISAESYLLDGSLAGDPLSADDVSFQLGAVYDLNERTAVYVNAAESFSPNTRTDPETGELFAPETSEAFEVGFKFDGLLNETLSGSVSYFDISKDNVVRSDFNPVTFTSDTIITSDNSKGLEFELFYNPTRNWNIVASYSHIDAKVVGALSPALEGLRLEGATPDRLTFFNSYSIEEGVLSGLRFGGGLVWADGPIQQFGNAANRLVIEDGYTQIDLFARYTADLGGREYTFGLNIDNVTDEIYVRSRAATNDARQYVFSVSTKL